MRDICAEMDAPGLAIIFGTRPEIIKLAPIIKWCEKHKARFYLIHTGQHYSSEMDEIFFRDFKLPPPTANLKCGNMEPGTMLGRMVERTSEVLRELRPSLVVVQGDTTSTLAGALAAKHCGIKIAHIESGLRSKDYRMLEEWNRILVDQLADYLFCPTPLQETHLKSSFHNGRVFVVGNTISDSLAIMRENIKECVGGYLISTIHRAENIKNPEVLCDVMKCLDAVGDVFQKKIIFPCHPHTRKMIESYNLKVGNWVDLVDPLGYSDFLNLLANSDLAITDSAGVVEEGCILGVPCITLRMSTERPETVIAGSNIIIPQFEPNIVVDAVRQMIGKKKWKHPYGENVADKIMTILDRGD